MYLGMQLQKGESLNDYHQALLDYFKDLDVENLYSKTKLEFAQDIYSVVDHPCTVNPCNKKGEKKRISLQRLPVSRHLSS